MSWVANVMISVDMDDTENAEVLSEWLPTEAPLRSGHERGGVGYQMLGAPAATPGSDQGPDGGPAMVAW